MKYLLPLVLLLSACSLHPGPFIAPVKTIDISLINGRACADSYKKASSYLLSEGIQLEDGSL
jgi:hypothetical protein